MKNRTHKKHPYINVGGSTVLDKSQVLGIFDLDTSTVSQVTKNYINKMQKEGKLNYGDSDLPRSFVVYENKEGQAVELSRISTSGLKLRTESSAIELQID